MSNDPSNVEGSAVKSADSTTARPRPSEAVRGPLSGAMGIVLFLVLFGAAGYLTYRTFTYVPIPKADPIEMTFLCVETNKSFEGQMIEGDKWPVLSPFSGKMTGYPVEKCYWTKDGKRKEVPTLVILNESLGKSGDTICHDCGRLVIGHNPIPDEDVPLAEPEPEEPKPTPHDKEPGGSDETP